MLKKAMGIEGLDLVAVRMLYVNDANRKKYQEMFGQEIGVNEGESVIAFVFRGLEANSKIERVIGKSDIYSDSNTERNQKSLKACFKIQDNSVLFETKEQLLSLKFWFGGRITPKQMEVEKLDITSLN